MSLPRWCIKTEAWSKQKTRCFRTCYYEAPNPILAANHGVQQMVDAHGHTLIECKVYDFSGGNINVGAPEIIINYRDEKPFRVPEQEKKAHTDVKKSIFDGWTTERSMPSKPTKLKLKETGR